MAHKGWGEGWEHVEAPVAPPRAQLKRQQVKKQKPKHRVRNVLLSLLAVLLVLGSSVGWLAYNALAARDRLEAAVAMIPELERQVRDDPAAAAPQLAALQAATSEARTRTTGFLWTVASHLPVVGPNVDALVTITEIVDSLSHDVLPELSSAVTAVQPSELAPSNGRINLAPLLEVRDSVMAADSAVNRAITSISMVDRTPLVYQLANAADDLEGRLRDVSFTTATAARAVQLLPGMLGADGPRNWLILAQNNAEQRASGGIPGAVISLRTDNGQIQMREKGSTGWFPLPANPILPLTAEETALFGDRMGRWAQNVNLTPDFPRAAQLISAMWESVTGEQITGVLSMDPVLLQSLLAASGPVTFMDPYGEPVVLDGTNTASFLMSEIYARYEDPVVQDEVFGDAAEAVFNRMMGGDVNASAVVNALVEGADTGRLIVWSALPTEQALLAPTVLSGELRGSIPMPDGEIAPVVNVAFNITSGSKLGYYLDATSEITSSVIRPDGSQSFTLDLDLTNILAAGQGYTLPSYVIGNGPANGRIGIQMFIYAPEFGEIISVVDRDSGALDGALTTHNGLNLAVLTVDIDPAQTQHLSIVMLSGRQQRGPIQVRLTPGPR